MKVFIFAGQSNSAGYGKRIQLNPVPSWQPGPPDVSSDSSTQYQHPTLANFPMLYNSNNTGLMAGAYDAWGAFQGQTPKYSSGAIGEESNYGPELSFLKMFQEANPSEQVAAVKCVLGGSSIADWLTGSMGTILDAMIDQAAARLAAASITFEWAGFVWMQGESGCASYYPYLHPTIGQEYKDQLRAFLVHVRTKTSTSMPVVIGRIGNHMLLPNIIGTASSGENTPANRIGATENRRAQQVLVGSDPGNVWFDTDNLPVLQSGDSAYWYHHAGGGYLAMGERAYYAFSGAPAPPPPSPLVTVVKFDGIEQTSKTAIVTLNGELVGGLDDVIHIDVVDR
jgi:hypothetical protein